MSNALLDAFTKFFEKRPVARVETDQRTADLPSVQVAACALLLELAHADGECSDAGREYIDRALGRHFGLDADALRDLLLVAERERAKSIDHFAFTREIAGQYDVGQKMVLAEVMWGVVLTDGELAQDEAYLIRKIANLLNLPPAYLSEARSRAKGS